MISELDFVSDATGSSAVHESAHSSAADSRIRSGTSTLKPNLSGGPSGLSSSIPSSDSNLLFSPTEHRLMSSFPNELQLAPPSYHSSNPNASTPLGEPPGLPPGLLISSSKSAFAAEQHRLAKNPLNATQTGPLHTSDDLPPPSGGNYGHAPTSLYTDAISNAYYLMNSTLAFFLCSFLSMVLASPLTGSGAMRAYFSAYRIFYPLANSPPLPIEAHGFYTSAYNISQNLLINSFFDEGSYSTEICAALQQQHRPCSKSFFGRYNSISAVAAALLILVSIMCFLMLRKYWIIWFEDPKRVATDGKMSDFFDQLAALQASSEETLGTTHYLKYMVPAFFKVSPSCFTVALYRIKTFFLDSTKYLLLFMLWALSILIFRSPVTLIGDVVTSSTLLILGDTYVADILRLQFVSVSGDSPHGVSWQALFRCVCVRLLPLTLQFIGLALWMRLGRVESVAKILFDEDRKTAIYWCTDLLRLAKSLKDDPYPFTSFVDRDLLFAFNILTPHTSALYEAGFHFNVGSPALQLSRTFNVYCVNTQWPVFSWAADPDWAIYTTLTEEEAKDDDLNPYVQFSVSKQRNFGIRLENRLEIASFWLFLMWALGALFVLFRHDQVLSRFENVFESTVERLGANKFYGLRSEALWPFVVTVSQAPLLWFYNTFIKTRRVKIAAKQESGPIHGGSEIKNEHGIETGEVIPATVDSNLNGGAAGQKRVFNPAYVKLLTANKFTLTREETVTLRNFLGLPKIDKKYWVPLPNNSHHAYNIYRLIQLPICFDKEGGEPFKAAAVGVCLVEAPIRYVFSFVWDVCSPYRAALNTKSDLFRKVIKRESEHHFTILTRKWVPSPMMFRDFFVDIFFRRIDSKNIVIVTYDNKAKSKENPDESFYEYTIRNTKDDKGMPLSSTSTVRARLSTLIWLKESENPGIGDRFSAKRVGTSLTYYALTDPGGNLPAAIVKSRLSVLFSFLGETMDAFKDFDVYNDTDRVSGNETDDIDAANSAERVSRGSLESAFIANDIAETEAAAKSPFKSSSFKDSIDEADEGKIFFDYSSSNSNSVEDSETTVLSLDEENIDKKGTKSAMPSVQMFFPSFVSYAKRICFLLMPDTQITEQSSGRRKIPSIPIPFFSLTKKAKIANDADDSEVGPSYSLFSVLKCSRRLRTSLISSIVGIFLGRFCLCFLYYMSDTNALASRRFLLRLVTSIVTVSPLILCLELLGRVSRHQENFLKGPGKMLIDFAIPVSGLQNFIVLGSVFNSVSLYLSFTPLYSSGATEFDKKNQIVYSFGGDDYTSKDSQGSQFQPFFNKGIPFTTVFVVSTAIFLIANSHISLFIEFDSIMSDARSRIMHLSWIALVFVEFAKVIAGTSNLSRVYFLASLVFSQCVAFSLRTLVSAAEIKRVASWARFAEVWNDVYPNFKQEIQSDRVPSTQLISMRAAFLVYDKMRSSGKLHSKLEKPIPFQEIDFLDEPEIGKGQFSTVFVARYRNDIVALKQLNLQSVSYKSILMFLAEMQLLASLTHANVILFHGLVFDNCQVCMVMEYAKCGNLRDHLLSCEFLDWAKFKRQYSLEIASGMIYLHSRHRPVIHRDLKTQNVLVTEWSSVKLSDFGESRIIDEEKQHGDPTASHLSTSTSGVAGTALFMAPENLVGMAATTKSDVYSYGCVLVDIAMSGKLGELYMGGENFPRNELEFYKMVVGGWRPKIPEYWMTRAPAFCKLIADCWNSDPDKRPDFVTIHKVLFDWKNGMEALPPLMSISGPKKYGRFVIYGLNHAANVYSASENAFINRGILNIFSREHVIDAQKPTPTFSRSSIFSDFPSSAHAVNGAQAPGARTWRADKRIHHEAWEIAELAFDFTHPIRMRDDFKDGVAVRARLEVLNDHNHKYHLRWKSNMNTAVDFVFQMVWKEIVQGSYIIHMEDCDFPLRLRNGLKPGIRGSIQSTIWIQTSPDGKHCNCTHLTTVDVKGMLNRLLFKSNSDSLGVLLDLFEERLNQKGLWTIEYLSRPTGFDEFGYVHLGVNKNGPVKISGEWLVRLPADYRLEEIDQDQDF